MTGSRAAEIVRSLRDTWTEHGSEVAHAHVTTLTRDELEFILMCYVGSGRNTL